MRGTDDPWPARVRGGLLWCRGARAGGVAAGAFDRGWGSNWGRNSRGRVFRPSVGRQPRWNLRGRGFRTAVGRRPAGLLDGSHRHLLAVDPAELAWARVSHLRWPPAPAELALARVSTLRRPSTPADLAWAPVSQRRRPAIPPTPHGPRPGAGHRCLQRGHGGGVSAESATRVAVSRRSGPETRSTSSPARASTTEPGRGPGSGMLLGDGGVP